MASLCGKPGHADVRPCRAGLGSLRASATALRKNTGAWDPHQQVGRSARHWYCRPGAITMTATVAGRSENGCWAMCGRDMLFAERPCSSVDRVPASGAGDESSILSGGTTAQKIFPSFHLLGAWPSGRAPGLGPGGRQFKSARPDQHRCSSFIWNPGFPLPQGTARGMISRNATTALRPYLPAFSASCALK